MTNRARQTPHADATFSTAALTAALSGSSSPNAPIHLREWDAKETLACGRYFAYCCSFLIVIYSIAMVTESALPRPQWLENILFFLPLLVPLSTFIVIARWTGESYFVYS